MEKGNKKYFYRSQLLRHRRQQVPSVLRLFPGTRKNFFPLAQVKEKTADSGRSARTPPILERD